MYPLKQGYRNIKYMVKNHDTKMHDLVSKWDSSFKKSYDHSTVTLIKTLTVLKILKSAKYSKQNLLLHTVMVFDLAMTVIEHLPV